MQETKRCSICKEVKPRDQFYVVSSRQPHRLRPACKVCFSNISAQKYADKEEKRKMLDDEAYRMELWHSPAFAIKFWANVDMPVDGCWEWEGKRHRQGYGVVQIDGKPVMAHRISYEMHHGPIPDGLQVCHKCDNPPCLRPDHLFLGTQADNNRDRDQKGRAKYAYGEKSGAAKLSDDEVRRLRNDTHLTITQLSEKYGISRSQAWNLRNNKQRLTA